MENLVQYDSDEEAEYQQRHDEGVRKMRPSSISAPKRPDDDANYDDVAMDMSEDSDSPNERSESPHPHQQKKLPSNDLDVPPNIHRYDDNLQRKSPSRSGRSYDSNRSAESRRDREEESNSKESSSKRYRGDSQDRKDSRDSDRDRYRDDRDRNSHHRERDRSDKRRERSRSNDRRKRSLSRERDRERNSRHHKRSHSRERRRRSRSHDRGDRKPYNAYKVNKKLQAMEKMGLQIKTPDGEMTSAHSLQKSIAEGERARNEYGSEGPKYFNPTAATSTRFSEQIQKRKLLWNKAKDQGESSETSQQNKPSLLDKWQGTKFAQDSDGKVTSKFLRLMGVKDPNAVQVAEKEEPVKSQDQDLFQGLQAQYDVARATTHTMRGVGLGFNRQY